MRLTLVLAGAALTCLYGCGADLTGLLPDTTVSASVLEACEGIKTEEQMITSIVSARIDRANGVTKNEEHLSAIQQCAADALTTGVDYDACLTCKDAVLDQVFGN